MRAPRFVRWLLTALLRDDAGRDTVADLAEEFDEVAAERGTRSARGWYRRQVAGSLAARVRNRVARLAERASDAPSSVVRLMRVGGDLGPAVRSIRRTPWYSGTIVAVVALCIALSATVFAVVDGVLFKPLPYANSEELVAIELGFYRDNVYNDRVFPEDLDVWQAALPAVPLSAVRVVDESGFERANEPDLGVAHVRPNLLDVLGTRPLLGGFSEDDLELMRATRPPVRPALVTYDFWQTRLGGQVSILGAEIEPENPSYTPIRVAGVLPAGFVIPGKRDAAFLMAGDGHARRIRDTVVLARVPGDVAPEAFREQLEAVLQRAAQVNDERGGDKPDRAGVVPLDDALEGRLGLIFRGLFAAAATLILIGCLNVSGLMTARCFDRARDTGLRRAIGARASDVVRLVLVEHGLLFAVGTALGLAALPMTMRLASGLLPTDLHLLKAPQIDGRVVAFSVVAMLTSLCAAAIWPIVRSLQAGVRQSIASGGSAVTQRSSGLASRLLTVGQVMGAVLLVLSGGLLVGSLLRVQANETGYDPDGVVVAELGVAVWTEDEALRSNWGAIRVQTRSRLNEFLDQVRLLPGVTSAGAVDVAVLVGRLSYGERFDPVGVDRAERGRPPGTLMVGDPAGGLGIPVTPGFFDAAGISVLDGRAPTDVELAAGAAVVAVSQTYARENFGSERAVGRFIERKPLQEGQPPLEIVGVVADPRIGTWDAPGTSTVFTPYERFGGDIDPVIFVRGTRADGTLVADILRLSTAARPVVRPVRVQTATAMLGETIRLRRLQSWLFGAFAVSGLALTGVGLFGFVAMTMARRTREVGIRMALGATRDRLVRGLVREQLTPVLLGLVLGVGFAAWLVRFLEAYLYELSIYDTETWVGAVALVAAVTFAGALIPAWRASRVDPVRALRTE